MPGAFQELHGSQCDWKGERKKDIQEDIRLELTRVGKHWPVVQIQALCLFLCIKSYWHTAILVCLHII